MKKTVSVYDFRDEFQRAGRGEQFSYEGLEIIFNYLEEIESCSGVEEELDVIALCCDFAESDYEDIASNYDVPLDGLDEEDAEEQVINFLEEQGVFCGRTEKGWIVYRQF